MCCFIHVRRRYLHKGRVERLEVDACARETLARRRNAVDFVCDFE